MFFSDQTLKESNDQSGIFDVEAVLRALEHDRYSFYCFVHKELWECFQSRPEWGLSIPSASTERLQSVSLCSCRFTLWSYILNPSSLSQGFSWLIAYWLFSAGTCLWCFMPFSSLASFLIILVILQCSLLVWVFHKIFLYRFSVLHIVWPYLRFLNV